MRMRAALYILFVFLVSQPLLAQEPVISDNPLFPNPRPKRIFIGPFFGYNSNFHSGGFQTLGNPSFVGSDCGTFNTGGGNGIMGGIAAEYWFKPGGATAIQLRVYYEQKPGNFNATSATPLSYFDTNTSSVVNFSRSYTVDAKYNLLNIELTYKYDIPGLPHFGVEIGPKFGFLLSSQYYEQQALDPPSFKFPQTNSNVDVLFPAASIPGASTFRFGLKGGLQYEALVGPFLVTPAVWYDLGVTKIVSSWAVSSLAGSLDVKYGF